MPSTSLGTPSTLNIVPLSASSEVSPYYLVPTQRVIDSSSEPDLGIPRKELCGAICKMKVLKREKKS